MLSVVAYSHPNIGSSASHGLLCVVCAGTWNLKQSSYVYSITAGPYGTVLALLLTIVSSS